MATQQPGKRPVPDVTIVPKHDQSRPMKAVCYEGVKSVKVEKKYHPLITDPCDAVLKITSTCICGSDLHFYNGSMPGMEKGDQLGHEFMGIVEDVGPAVRNVKKGDRVIACFDIGCGRCEFCQAQKFSLCDITNKSQEEKELYGDRTAGFFGYSHLTGGWEGGQADYNRVPFADTNLLKVPDDIPDRRVVFLSDILPTAWWANEMGEVGQGDVVAIWGCGPVGQLAAHCAMVRGAQRVIVIDNVQYRLDHVKKYVPGVETINFDNDEMPKALRKLVPGGPDVSIEAVGTHYHKSLTSKIETSLKLENDPSDMLNEMIWATRKGGRISIVGVYVGFTNHFNIGAFMEKGMTMRGGQTPCQKYWRHLLKMVLNKELDPTFVITHEIPLDEAPKGYKIFNDKEDRCVKVVMHPHPPVE